MLDISGKMLKSLSHESILLCIVLNVIGLSVLTVSLECGENEYLHTCINRGCEYRKCSDIGRPVECDLTSPKYCEEGCACNSTYLRAEDGTCIPASECPYAQICSKSNEYYDLCPVACPSRVCNVVDNTTCDDPLEVGDPNCLPAACRCNIGFFRDVAGNCVLERMCAFATATVDTSTSTAEDTTTEDTTTDATTAEDTTTDAITAEDTATDATTAEDTTTDATTTEDTTVSDDSSASDNSDTQTGGTADTTAESPATQGDTTTTPTTKTSKTSNTTSTTKTSNTSSTTTSTTTTTKTNTNNTGIIGGVLGIVKGLLGKAEKIKTTVIENTRKHIIASSEDCNENNVLSTVINNVKKLAGK